MFPFLAAMKRVAILLDSQQADPRAMDVVKQALRGMMSAPKETVDALLGHMPNQPGETKDYSKHYQVAVRAFLEYLEVCAKRNVSFSSLDECLVGWGRRCIRVEEMYGSTGSMFGQGKRNCWR